MAEATGVLRVDVVSPERVLFTGDAKQVITRTIEGGEVAFLPGHAAFLGALVENHTRIYLTDGSIKNLAVHLGFVEVGADHVTILSDAAELEEDIDVARARAAKERAEEQLRKEHTAEVESDLRRAHARLSAAGGLGASH
ncbi:MAG: ATP synthase F1 subunit epsilon [Actinobacteria bacterium]|jgi:F-type H+-transporting ATPase subunit epsilon|nr:ATP synthase F1 subunit epsilon [Actinomycetota bacterium]NBU16289.1 ATP synthase F1 subunit epsilon [Actinomycetota bacterium]